MPETIHELQDRVFLPNAVSHRENLGNIRNNSRALGDLRDRKSYDECVAAVCQKTGSLQENDPLRW